MREIFEDTGIISRCCEDEEKRFLISSLQRSYVDRVREISYEWLNENDCLEQEDIQILSDPLAYIAHNGGEFYVGLIGDEIVGCVALLRHEYNAFEIAKLGVDKAYRSKGYGFRLIMFSINRAKELGASKVILYTNSALKSALKLYESIGFSPVMLDGANHEKADLKMELVIE